MAREAADVDGASADFALGQGTLRGGTHTRAGQIDRLSNTRHIPALWAAGERRTAIGLSQVVPTLHTPDRSSSSATSSVHADGPHQPSGASKQPGVNQHATPDQLCQDKPTVSESCNRHTFVAFGADRRTVPVVHKCHPARACASGPACASDLKLIDQPDRRVGVELACIADGVRAESGSPVRLLGLTWPTQRNLVGPGICRLSLTLGRGPVRHIHHDL